MLRLSYLFPAIHVGNYVTSKFIGKGGFGNVYLAAHQITGKEVALKLMPMEVRYARA